MIPDQWNEESPWSMACSDTGTIHCRLSYYLLIVINECYLENPYVFSCRFLFMPKKLFARPRSASNIARALASLDNKRVCHGKGRRDSSMQDSLGLLKASLTRVFSWSGLERSIHSSVPTVTPFLRNTVKNTPSKRKYIIVLGIH